MFSYRFLSVVVCLVLSLASLIAGCQSGSARPPASPPPESADAAADGPTHGIQELGLRLVFADADGIHPRVGAKADALLPEGGAPVREAQLPGPINIRGPLLLEWRGVQFGSTITHAHFIFTSGGGGATSVESDASYDQDADRWRIKLAPMLGSGDRELDPAILHTLKLELTLGDGSSQNYSLRILARSMIHGISVVREITQPVPSFDALYSQAHDSFLLRRELISNPLPRKIRVWVRGVSQSLKFVSYHEIPRWNYPEAPANFILGPEFADTGPARTSLDRFKAEVPVNPTVLRIGRGSAFSFLSLPPADWTSFDLESRESVQIDWHGTISAEIAACNHPTPVRKQLIWRVPFHNFAQTEMVEDSQQLGLRLSGQWTRELRYSEVDVEQVPDFDDASSAAETLKIAFGQDFPDDLPSMACVGLYPRAGM